MSWGSMQGLFHQITALRDSREARCMCVRTYVHVGWVRASAHSLLLMPWPSLRRVEWTENIGTSEFPCPAVLGHVLGVIPVRGQGLRQRLLGIPLELKNRDDHSEVTQMNTGMPFCHWAQDHPLWGGTMTLGRSLIH